MRTQPHKGYSTKAWNPPKKWVSPERIALAAIPAKPQLGCETFAISMVAFDSQPNNLCQVSLTQFLTAFQACFTLSTNHKTPSAILLKMPTIASKAFVKI